MITKEGRNSISERAKARWSDITYRKAVAEKISKTLTGRKDSAETRHRKSIAKRDHSWKKGRPAHNKGFRDPAAMKNQTKVCKECGDSFIGYGVDYCSLECSGIANARKGYNKPRTSKPEKAFLDMLENLYGIGITRSRNLGRYYYDGQYRNVLIEVDGSYWHSGLFRKRNDELKTFEALDNGFSLLRVEIDKESDVLDTILFNLPTLDKHFS